MRMIKIVVAMTVGLLLLAGCATGPGGEPVSPFAALFQPGKAEQALAAGIKQFEDGEYADATKTLQSALELGLVKAPDRSKAHKYLAFIHCVSGRQRPCQEEFRKALEDTPGMELEPSEVGHPIWGPEFRNAKARSK